MAEHSERKRVRRPSPRSRRRVREPDQETHQDTDTNMDNRVLSPDFYVGVVPDLHDNKIGGHDQTCFANARHLASSGVKGKTGAVVAIIFSKAEACADFSLAGADRVLVVPESTELSYFAPEYKANVLKQIISEEFKYLIFPDSIHHGGDVGRRVAAALGVRAATSVVTQSDGTVTSRAYAGTMDVTRPTPSVLLIAEEATGAVRGQYEAAAFPCPKLLPLKLGISDKGLCEFDSASVNMTEAEIVIGCGNGVSDFKTVNQIAQIIGASVGGSRMVIDRGDLPREKQIGASGQTITARCYIALGISGAPQHLQGITSCANVLAINTDSTCEMVKRADFGVIGDVQTILPGLLEGLSKKNDD